MRSRHLPHRVVPINTFFKDSAASKIQSIHRGRIVRQEHLKIKVGALSTLLPALRNDVSNLKKQYTLMTNQIEMITSSLNQKHHSEKSVDSILPGLRGKSLSFITNEKDNEETENINISNEGVRIVDEDGYNLSASMWDVSLLFGLNEVGSAGSIYGIVLLILNIGIQFVFSYIVATTFTIPVFSDGTILGFRSWRRNVAQNAKFMDTLSEVSLSSRICNNDSGLEVSGSQAEAHQNLSGYLNGNIGVIMCALTVTIWLLTVVKELTSLSNFWRVILYIPYDKEKGTQVSNEGNSFVSISKQRRWCVLCIQLCRLAVVSSLGYAGTAWLVNTVSVTDLILNAVALEFVLCVDEIIFEALAPRNLKIVLDNFASLEMSFPAPKEWKGLDTQSFSLFISTCCILMTIWFLMIIPFENNLKLADDALCAGYQDFVYTISETGVPLWSPSQSYLSINEDADLSYAKSTGTGQWSLHDNVNEELEDQESKNMNFVLKMIDNIINKKEIYDKTEFYNVSRKECGDDILFNVNEQSVTVPVCIEDKFNICILKFCDGRYYRGIKQSNGEILGAYSDEENACCAIEQILSPSIQGGRLSLNGFEAETVSNAIEIWNPACADTLGQFDTINDDDYYYNDEEDYDESVTHSFMNLQGGAFSDAIGGKCGLCPAHLSFCDPITQTCMPLNCSVVIPHCFEDTTAGVRARQFCPETCGCSDPRDSLVLTDPALGCPSTCIQRPPYQSALDEVACKDNYPDSTELRAYVSEVDRISADWPPLWRDTWTTLTGPLFADLGCWIIPHFRAYQSLPMDFCIPGGTIWPIKPMTTLCPFSCNCMTEDLVGCPSSCANGAESYSFSYL
mmetsp:Transcript_26913/g.31738  ORF Transcript_26913/g.31738 Transcript_26913/m.31738 type:complete len:850 (+) Transcript_26913:181-2730(+)